MSFTLGKIIQSIVLDYPNGGETFYEDLSGLKEKMTEENSNERISVVFYFLLERFWIFLAFNLIKKALEKKENKKGDF